MTLLTTLRRQGHWQANRASRLRHVVILTDEDLRIDGARRVVHGHWQASRLRHVVILTDEDLRIDGARRVVHGHWQASRASRLHHVVPRIDRARKMTPTGLEPVLPA